MSRFLETTLALVSFFLAFILAQAMHAETIDRAQELKYRRDREAWMRSEDSPLAFAGLFWLKVGVNTFGTDPSNDLILPRGTAPGKIGRLIVSGETVKLVTENPAAQLKLGNQIVHESILKTDDAESLPDMVYMGDLRFKVIRRGSQFALRLIYVKNPPLLAFAHLDFFEIDPTYNLNGTFVPYRPPRKIKVISVTGQVEEMICPGVVRFNLGGRNQTLQPVLESPNAKELFFIFKDSTNGTETYAGGRFLYSPLPEGTRVVLDFNQAHNPYCAYSSYSTCPLPPFSNWLKIPIRAGEKKYPRQ
ncbi:MAG TPA: DUF1684 domain-containing protein [Terriglobia bacterium]|nr:DUF1684 domain-containing protein [Terriglobia bacterium]